MTPLSVRGVSRSFGGLHALANVSFELQSGERRAFIGTNGAGKTTLFNVINGQLRATSGQIWLFGEEATRMPAHARAARGLARTFQINSLFPELTVLDNMALAVQAVDRARYSFYKRRDSYAHILDQARAHLARWRLLELHATLVKELSYGVQRQLEIVLALAGRPRLVLLDEPMAGLSASETRLAIEVILSLDRSITVLMIEHDLEAAFEIADRITAMDQGRIVADGTPDELRAANTLERLFMGAYTGAGESRDRQGSA